MPSPKLTPLDEAERAELEAWLAEHAESLPEPVRAALEQHHALCEGLRGSRHKLSQVLFELRRALGISLRRSQPAHRRSHSRQAQASGLLQGGQRAARAGEP